MCVRACVCSWSLHLCCQDVPSFVSTLSRCLIFRQFMSYSISLFLSVCVCVCVCVHGAFICVVKMFHLSSARCQDVSSLGSSCHILSLSLSLSLSLCVCVCSWSLHLCCQDVPSFVSTLSRCLIFRQFMSYSLPLSLSLSLSVCQDLVCLSLSLSVCVCVCVCVCVFMEPSFVLSRCSIFRQHAVKMSHL